MFKIIEVHLLRWS